MMGIHKAVSTLKQWSLLVRQKEKQQVDEIIAKLMEALTRAEYFCFALLSFTPGCFRYLCLRG